MTQAGSAGSAMPMGGAPAGGAAAAQGGAPPVSQGGAGSWAGGTSVYDMCGDGVCSYFEMPNVLAPCPKDCWGVCGNGIKEPQDLWTCPNDGTPVYMPPPAPGWIDFEYSTKGVCDFGSAEPELYVAYCDPSLDACLDNWPAHPPNYKGQNCWGGGVHAAQLGISMQAPAGTYTFSAITTSSLGVSHLVNAKGVVVPPGGTAMVKDF